MLDSVQNDPSPLTRPTGAFTTYSYDRPLIELLVCFLCFLLTIHPNGALSLIITFIFNPILTCNSLHYIVFSVFQFNDIGDMI